MKNLTLRYSATQFTYWTATSGAASFSAPLIPQIPPLLTGVFYMIGIWSSDAMVPLLNALSVAYQQAGYSINYGAARGIGSAATVATWARHSLSLQW